MTFNDSLGSHKVSLVLYSVVEVVTCQLPSERGEVDPSCPWEEPQVHTVEDDLGGGVSLWLLRNTTCHSAQPRENQPTPLSITRFCKWVMLYKYKVGLISGVLSGHRKGGTLHNQLSFLRGGHTQAEPRGIQNSSFLHSQPASSGVGLQISALGATSACDHCFCGLWEWHVSPLDFLPCLSFPVAPGPPASVGPPFQKPSLWWVRS